MAPVIMLGLLAAGCVPGKGGVVTGDGAGKAKAVSEAAAETVATDGVQTARSPAARSGATGRSIPGSYLAGLHAERIGEIGVATDFLRYALDQDPDNLALLQRTFLLALGDGREAAARDLAQRLAKRIPGAPLPNLVLVVEDMKAGQYAKAQKRLEALPESGLNKFLTPLALSWVLLARDQPDAAIAALKPLADNSGFAVLRDLHVALIDDVAGRLDEAEAGYVNLLENGQGGASLRVIQALGSLYERTGRPKKARALYEKYMARNPDSVLLGDAFKRLDKGLPVRPMVATAEEGLAEALFNLASTLQQQSVGKLALNYARLALILRPDFPVDQTLLADIFDGLGRDREAIAIYETIDPKSAFGWLARMRVAINLDAQGRTKEALARLKEMAGERPKRTDALITMGDILRSHDRFAEAAKVYSRAVARIGTLAERHWSLLYARGISLERTGRWALAETDFLRALELRPEQPYVLNYLGYSWVEKGINLDRARHMLERAAALRPNDGYIIDSLGWVLFRLGLFKEAADKLEHAVEMEPEDPTINDHLGDALWRVGRKTEARFQWRRALGLKPDPKAVAGIRSKLKNGLEVTRADKPGS